MLSDRQGNAAVPVRYGDEDLAEDLSVRCEKDNVRLRRMRHRTG